MALNGLFDLDFDSWIKFGLFRQAALILKRAQQVLGRNVDVSELVKDHVELHRGNSDFKNAESMLA